jgi:2-keto-3-deoxy-6-phosphogluconate aldolase
VPCRPFLLDIASVRQTQDVIARLNKLYAITLNAVTPRVSARVADAAQALGGVVSPSVASRYAIPDALAHGLAPCEVEPNGQAAAEFRELWGYVKGRLV